MPNRLESVVPTIANSVEVARGEREIMSLLRRCAQMGRWRWPSWSSAPTHGPLLEETLSSAARSRSALGWELHPIAIGKEHLILCFTRPFMWSLTLWDVDARACDRARPDGRVVAPSRWGVAIRVGERGPSCRDADAPRRRVPSVAPSSHQPSWR